MVKEIGVQNNLKLKIHPILIHPKKVGEKAADFLTTYMGSWLFILIFFLFLLGWVGVNGFYLVQYERGNPFDPFPFILLNLALSCLAALQAPIILMSQNRQAQKDRVRAEYDYAVNRKAQREIEEIKKQLNRIEKKCNITIQRK